MSRPGSLEVEVAEDEVRAPDDGPEPRPSSGGSPGRTVWLLRRIALRLGRFGLVLFIVTLLTFLLFNLLPGDPAAQLLGTDATPEQLDRLREQMRLDEPLVERYGDWIGGAIRGDLGESARDGTDVRSAILHRLPITLEIMVLAQVLGLAVAIPLGILLAVRAGSKLDKVLGGAVVGMMTIPNFIAGLFLIFVFALKLGWFPATGFVRISEGGLGENLRSVALPVTTIALAQIAVYARTLRADLIQTFQEDFIEVATSKGLPTRRILLFHSLRPSSLSLVTLTGLNVARLIGGAVIVEVLFAIPGVGQLLVLSIGRRDVIVLQGIVLSVAVAYVLVNALVDVLYQFLDPRIRDVGD